MRILLTGKSGQVGSELQRALAPLGDVIAYDRSQLDLADSDEVIAAVRKCQPQMIVNAGAYTAVDRAEVETNLARAVNAQAPGLLSEEARRMDALLVHYSTDYVFDGSKQAPYSEQDIPNPVNAYGRTKLEGERAIQASGCRYLILRTSWVYGPSGKNFLRTMLRLASEKSEIRVVDDQIGAPTSCIAIADATARILSQHPQAYGLYHLSAAGQTSWHGFARAILSHAGKTTAVVPIPSSDYPTPATRPHNSLLDNTAFKREFGFFLPDWKQGMVECMHQIIVREAG